MDEFASHVTVAHFHMWDLACGLWRLPVRKAMRQRIVLLHGVTIEGTEEDVPIEDVNDEGWYVGVAHATFLPSSSSMD